jgi:hypothetical protein
MDISLALELFVNDVSGPSFGSSGLGAEVGIWGANANPATDVALAIVLGPYDTFGSQGVPNPVCAFERGHHRGRHCRKHLQNRGTGIRHGPTDQRRH